MVLYRTQLFSLLTVYRQSNYKIREFVTQARQEKIICYASELFYAKKGEKTAQFQATVVPDIHPWDNSFSDYMLSDNGGIKYFAKRGVVGSTLSYCPLATMFYEAREQTHRGVDYSAERAIFVTNRLTWGSLRSPDVVIGDGKVSTTVIIFNRTYRSVSPPQKSYSRSSLLD